MAVSSRAMEAVCLRMVVKSGGWLMSWDVGRGGLLERLVGDEESPGGVDCCSTVGAPGGVGSCGVGVGGGECAV